MAGKLIVRGALTARLTYLTEDGSQRLFTAFSERDEELKRARERGNEHRRQRGYDLYPILLMPIVDAANHPRS